MSFASPPILKVSATLDRGKLNRFRRRYGEVSRDALVRLGVFVSREVALRTEVAGRFAKKQKAAITTGARTNIIGVKARPFTQLRSARKPFAKINGQWVRLGPDQILATASEINSFIERNRDSRGRVRTLPPARRAIAREDNLRKVITLRKKRAGMAKGSWLGAGMRASKFHTSRVKSRARIGKNFIGWAQKHANLGTAKFRNRPFAARLFLISKAKHTKSSYVFKRRESRLAIRGAWRKTLSFYRRAMKDVDRGS